MCVCVCVCVDVGVCDYFKQRQEIGESNDIPFLKLADPAAVFFLPQNTLPGETHNHRETILVAFSGFLVPLLGTTILSNNWF